MKLFILYDGRAKFGDTDDAAVMVCADTEEEAAHEGRTTWRDYDAIWFEYDVAAGDELVNERRRDDLPPANAKARP